MKNCVTNFFLIIVFCNFITACGSGSSDNVAPDEPPPDEPKKTGVMTLKNTKFWAYQIQAGTDDGAMKALKESTYDMLVIDVFNTDAENVDFPMKSHVSKLKASRAANKNRTKLVIAYVSVGEAEDFRTYWDPTWTPPTPTARGNPSFLFRSDPDGWEGIAVVDYTDQRWKDIFVNEVLHAAIDAGFAGIYMDWIEAFSHDELSDELEMAGKHPADEMAKFICEIRDEARKRDEDFLIIQQNAPDLIDEVTDVNAYLDCLDAIAEEQIYYDGDATDDPDDSDGCDKKVPETGHGYSAKWYETQLAKYQQTDMVVFSADYACKQNNADTAYTRAKQQGFVPYVSQRALAKLTDTPPPGLPPSD